MRTIKFGTDGYRGVIADSFTVSHVRSIAHALARYAYAHHLHDMPVVIGYDRRFLSDFFAKIIAEILNAHGIAVHVSLSAVPTPAISRYIVEQAFSLGVIVTASHNPAEFNGIKIKNKFGASAGKDVTAELEQYIAAGESAFAYPRVPAAATTIVDVVPLYVRHLKKFLDMKSLRRSRYTVLVDAMHGVGAGIVDAVLTQTSSVVTTIRGQRDVLFGGVNPEPIEKNLGALRAAMRTQKIDLGIALDGDADRIGAMTPDGKFISSHMAICLILLHLLEDRQWRGTIVKSINTTTMVERIAAQYGCVLEEVPVGFKYIAEKMIADQILLGGEESGGIGVKGYIPERDGSLAGLLILEMMASRGQGVNALLADMRRRFGRFEYVREDLSVRVDHPIAHPSRIAGKTIAHIKTYDGTKFIFDDESWLLIRASGTEPIVRVYAEAATKKEARALIEAGKRLL